MTTEATTEKKQSARMGFGCRVNVFDDAKQRSHFRPARFLAYVGTKITEGRRVSLVKVSYDDGGLDCVDRRNVEKIGS